MLTLSLFLFLIGGTQKFKLSLNLVMLHVALLKRQ